MKTDYVVGSGKLHQRNDVELILEVEQMLAKQRSLFQGYLWSLF